MSQKMLKKEFYVKKTCLKSFFYKNVPKMGISDSSIHFQSFSISSLVSDSAIAIKKTKKFNYNQYASRKITTNIFIAFNEKIKILQNFNLFICCI